MVVLGDQDSLTPFAHCMCQGGADGFVKLAFHAGTVRCGDDDGEVNSCLHVTPTFSGVDGLRTFGDALAVDKTPTNLVETQVHDSFRFIRWCGTALPVTAHPGDGTSAMA